MRTTRRNSLLDLILFCEIEKNRVVSMDKSLTFPSYYDLIKRLWRASHIEHIKRKLKPKSFYPKPRKKLKAGQKLPPKHSGVVKKLVSLSIRGKLREERPEIIFQDGSCYNSGASHYGVKVCDCRSKGIYDCKCSRRYSDSDARWGWDSYHKVYFYGNTLFSTTASDSPYDLSIYLRIAQGTNVF